MKKPLLGGLALITLTWPGTAFAFQSDMLDCGFRFIGYGLLVAVILFIIAVVKTIQVVRHKKKRLNLILWWFSPLIALGIGVALTGFCHP